jgi:hypothetical protein
MLDLRAEFFRSKPTRLPKEGDGLLDAVESRAALIDFCDGLMGVEMRRLANGKIAFCLREDDALGPKDAFLSPGVFVRFGGAGGFIELALSPETCREEGVAAIYDLKNETRSLVTLVPMPETLEDEYGMETLLEKAWAHARGL